MARDKDQERELEKKDRGSDRPKNDDFGADESIITDRVPPPDEEKKKK